jgi:dynein heavy chain 2
VLKKNLHSRIKSFEQDVEKLSARWNQFKPKEADMQDEGRCSQALKVVKERDVEVQEYMKQAEKIREECRNFQVEEPQFKDVYAICEDINEIKSVWGVYEEFQTGMWTCLLHKSLGLYWL